MTKSKGLNKVIGYLYSKMNESLDYRLLNPRPVDEATEAAIISSIDGLVVLMNFSGQQSKPKIVVDNVSISMRRPTPKIITAVGYVLGDNAVYCYSPTTVSMKVPLQKPLEEMTDEELQGIKTYGSYINHQIFVVLRDYVLEQPEQ